MAHTDHQPVPKQSYTPVVQPASRVFGVLALQRRAGNHATSTLIRTLHDSRASALRGSPLRELVVQRTLNVAGNSYNAGSVAGFVSQIGTSAARAGNWQQRLLQQRATMLARGNATHSFTTVAAFENAMILQLAMEATGTAWAGAAGLQTGNYSVDRVNGIVQDLRRRLEPAFRNPPEKVHIVGYEFERTENEGGGFWLKPVKRLDTNKRVVTNVSTYVSLAPDKAKSLLNQLENADHAIVHADDLPALVTLIVALIAESARWPGQNVFTALTLSEFMPVPTGHAVTGKETGVLPMSAGSTWDEVAAMPQDLARARVVERLRAWPAALGAGGGLGQWLLARFDAAADEDTFRRDAAAEIARRLPQDG